MKEFIDNVILIDDCEVDQLIYTRILKRSNIVKEVISFSYADEALAYLKSNRKNNVDLILLDINMPRMNGFEFLEEAEEADIFSQIKAIVVMLTTSLNPDDQTRASKYDIVKKFINKPLSEKDVLEIRELIAKTK